MDKVYNRGNQRFIRISAKAVAWTFWLVTPIGVAAQSSGESLLEEIVVSAKRTNVTAMSMPSAVTALSAEEIEQFQILDARDLQARVNSLVIAEELMIPKVFIRGIGQESTTISHDPGVAIHADGIYRGRGMSSFSAHIDLAAVEVLRGPQGTLYGRNATAGTINYVSNRPTEENSLRVTGLLGDYDRVDVKLVGNAAFSETVQGRLAVAHQNRDGYVEDLAGGKDRDDFEVTAARASLLFRPTNEVDVLLAFDALSEESNGPAFLALDLPVFPVFFGGAVPNRNVIIIDDERKTYKSPDNVQPAFTEREDFGVLLEVNWNISSELTLKSLTGYRSFTHDQAQDSDATSVPWVGANAVDDEADQFSQEFNLIVTKPSFDAVFGLFAFIEDAESANDVPFLQGIPNPAAPGGFAPPFLLTYVAEQDVTSYAAFADATIQLPDVDWMRVLAGIRYTNDKKEVEQRSGATSYLGGGYGSAPAFTFDSCGNPFFPVAELAGHSADESWSEWTGSLGLEFDVGEHGMAYAKASRGYKGGGFSDFPTSPAVCGAPFDPEEAITYEAGLKFAAMDNRFSASLAFFSTSYDDLQVQSTELAGTRTVNAAKARIRGFEADFDWRIAQGLSLDGFISLLDGEYKDFDYVYPLDPMQQVVNLKGVDMPRTPDYSGLLGVEYTHMISGSSSGLTARVEGYFTDDVSLTPGGPEFGNQLAVQKGYETYNAYLTYWNEDLNDLTIRFFAKNLTDEFYLTAVLPLASTFNHMGFAAPPRTWGVEVAVTF